MTFSNILLAVIPAILVFGVMMLLQYILYLALKEKFEITEEIIYDEAGNYKGKKDNVKYRGNGDFEFLWFVYKKPKEEDSTRKHDIEKDSKKVFIEVTHNCNNLCKEYLNNTCTNRKNYSVK